MKQECWEACEYIASIKDIEQKKQKK
jgi:hypothetical protein